MVELDKEYKQLYNSYVGWLRFLADGIEKGDISFTKKDLTEELEHIQEIYWDGHVTVTVIFPDDFDGDYDKL